MAREQRPAPAFEGVVLAAGRSRRAGAFKPALAVRGRTLVVHAAGSLLAHCRRVVVVTGHEAAQVNALVAGLAQVDTAPNPDPDGDMFSSARVGLAAVAADAAGVFVLPVDCPFVEPAVLDAMVAAFAAAGGGRAVVPTHGGRGGHPVLLPPAVRALAAAATAGATLRDLVAACDPIRLPVDSAAVLTDLDTPADLDRL